MRIGAIVLLQGLHCVQSYEWKTIRPLGDLQGVVTALDSYCVDEIAIINILRGNKVKIQSNLEQVKKLRTSSPISIGGGIRSIDKLTQLSDLPVERIVFSSALLDESFDLLDQTALVFGRQSVQGLLPFKKQSTGAYHFYNSRSCIFEPIKENLWKEINKRVNELIFYDVSSEGSSCGFDFNVFSGINIPIDKIILARGVGKSEILEARKRGFAAVLIENRILHKENSIRDYQ